VQAVLAAVCAAWVSACGSTEVTTSTSPSSVVRCGLTLSVPETAIESAGGSEQVTLTTTPECAWTASADANWIARIDPASGQGSGTLRVDVGPNPAASMRQASIVVNGVRAQIQQEPAPCDYTVSGSGAQQISPAGGAFQVTVTTTSGCTWAVTSAASWMRVTSGSPGIGTGVVQFSVDPNDGGERVSALAIAGQSFTVTQAATLTPGPVQCSYSFNPAAVPVPASGGAGPLLSLTTTCGWSASTNVPWITLTSAAGNGSGPISFTVAANTGAARTGTISVGSALATVNQAAATPCSFNLSPGSTNAPADGSSGSLSLSTGPSCSWTAGTGASWITITSGRNGQGNGTIAFDVAANSGSARSGTITVGSTSATINQAAAAPSCSFGLNPPTLDIGSGASADLSIGVSTTPSCSWTATSGASWITITSGATGSGNGTIKYNVAANPGGARSSTITVGSSTTTINQAAAPPACSVTATPTSFDVSAAAGNRTVNVTSGSSCNWAAESFAPWITVTSGANGSGNAAVGFSFTTNTGSSSRSGTLIIGGQNGQTVTVNQAGLECNLTVSPLTFTPPAGGATNQTVTVTGPASCAWTAASNAPSWLTITSGASGSGNGSVRFNVAANPGAARNGTLTVAGQTVTVNQAAVACSFGLSANSFDVPATAGNRTISVSSGSSCNWTAASNTPAWITVTSGATGSGNGNVGFSFAANTGPGRNGTLTVAGQTVTVNQATGCLFTVTVTPQPLSFPGNGGTALATVETTTGCTWTGSTTEPSWITVPGGNRTGSGTLSITVAANPDNKARNGEVTVAGRTFEVNEAKR